MSGWVKLHRVFQKWEWYDQSNCVAVFIDLLLQANHEDSKYRGVNIPKGAMTTSQMKIAERTGLTVRQVRTVLDKLSSTGEVSVKTNNQFSMISITNWEKFQSDDRQPVTRMSDGCKTDVKRMSTSKNLRTKEDKNNVINTGLFTGDRTTDLEEFPTSDAARNVLNLMNAVLFTRFGATEKNLRFVNGRLAEGFKLDDFKKVFEVKKLEWDGTEMAKYLRPSTLLGTKFDEYLSQAENALKSKSDPLEDFLFSTGVTSAQLRGEGTAS